MSIFPTTTTLGSVFTCPHGSQYWGSDLGTLSSQVQIVVSVTGSSRLDLRSGFSLYRVSPYILDTPGSLFFPKCLRTLRFQSTRKHEDFLQRRVLEWSQEVSQETSLNIWRSQPKWGSVRLVLTWLRALVLAAKRWETCWLWVPVCRTGSCTLSAPLWRFRSFIKVQPPADITPRSSPSSASGAVIKSGTYTLPLPSPLSFPSPAKTHKRTTTLFHNSG